MPVWLQDFVLDAWTAISHKEIFRHRTPLGPQALAPSWVGDHARRLAAYKMLQAYQDNAGRFFLPAATSFQDREDRREYGDAALLVNVVLGALLGDDQSIVVDGADADPPPDAVEGYVSPEAERQDWLAGWSDDERLRLKMIETERNSIGLGDGVYYVAWDAGKQRPVIRVFDPGWYFPAIESGSEDDYPTRVHIAWEEHDRDSRTLVHRITWELGPIRPATDLEGLPLFDEAGGLVLLPGDVWRDDGTISRTLAYHEPGESTDVTCYMTEATWTVDAMGGRHVDDFSYENATFAVNAEGFTIRELDLGVDFVPVVHIPNTVAILNHYGKAVLATVLQLLDDIHLADTDLATTAKLLGFPPLVVSGIAKGNAIRLTAPNGRPVMDSENDGNTSVGYKPGTVWKVPEGGKLDMLDTSRALDALIKYVEHLVKRLTINARVPDSVLGRVKASEVASGVQLAMMFGPLQAMVSEMRMVRDEKYPMLLRFVQRFAIAAGALEMPVMAAAVQFGSYLPSDRQAIVTQVVALLTGHAISTETAVGMLVEVGFPIDDARSEVERIQYENFSAAVELLAALGDEGQVAEYLGRPAPTGPPPPPINLPNLGGSGGAGGS